MMMDFVRMMSILDSLRRRGALASLQDYTEIEIRAVAQHFGVHLPDRPLVPPQRTPEEARQIAEAYIEARRRDVTRREDEYERRRAAAEAARQEREETERHLQAVNDAINIFDRPRWARTHTTYCAEMREARVGWTFAAGSDDNFAEELSASARLSDVFDDLLHPDNTFTSHDIAPPIGRPFRFVPKTQLWRLGQGRFAAYLMALDSRLQTFEEAEVEGLSELDPELQDWRSQLTLLAIADEVPHLTTCWSYE